jgi:hypothetical protein
MIIREEQKKKNRKDRESDGRIYLFRGTGKRFYPSNFWKYCSGAERACPASGCGVSDFGHTDPGQ